MYLPVQREPIQRSIVGLRSDLQSCASGAVKSDAADRRGIEPSGFFDDFLKQQNYMNEWSRSPVATLGSFGI
jgi:hypothetical protein